MRTKLELTRADLKARFKNTALGKITPDMFKHLSAEDIYKYDLVIFSEDHDGEWDERLKVVYREPKMYKILKATQLSRSEWESR